MGYNISKLKQLMQGIVCNIVLKDSFEEINTVAGFDVSFTQDNKIICAAVVFNAKTLEVVEIKKVIKDSSMPYISGFEAFRKGPAMLEAYYSLENEPDLLFIEGDGIIHQEKCGLATYLGVELEKPTIGISKKLLAGEIKGDNIITGGEIVGKLVKTKEYANPVIVSPGNLISVETAARFVKEYTFHPHKLPEPIHKAHRVAKKNAKKIRTGEETIVEEQKQEIVEKQEIDVDKKAIQEFSVGTY